MDTKKEGLRNQPWSLKVSQPVPTGLTAEDIEEATQDPKQEVNKQEEILNPEHTGRELGKLALINQLVESKKGKEIVSKMPYVGDDIARIADQMRGEIDNYAKMLVGEFGRIDVFEPHLVENLFTQLMERYDDTSVGIAQETASETINNPDVQNMIRRKFQTLFNQVMQEQVRERAPYGGAAFYASRRGILVTAQPDGSPYGPLLAQPYESEEHLKNDLHELAGTGTKEELAELYNRVLGELNNNDSVKPLLQNFLQGSENALSQLYQMFVESGKASPINKEMVEETMEKHPELASEKKAPGLWLPPEGMTKQASGGVGGTATHYYSYGSDEKRYCPKLRNVINCFVCRYHCLDGLPVDDNQILCGEAIWRQAVMDKYSREYKDKDGNWVGGYINKRFEVERDTGGHPYQLKPGKRSSPIKEDAWSQEKRLQEMRRNEASNRGYSKTPGDPKNLYNHDPYEELGTVESPQLSEKTKDPIAKIASRGQQVIRAFSMWDEPVEAKKKDKPVNPWAVCHTTVDKKEAPEKYEECVLGVKEKHPIRKDKKKSSSDWSVKEAMPSPADVVQEMGGSGKECQNCGMTCGNEARECPNCKSPNLKSKTEMEMASKAKTITKEDSGLMPPMASAGGARLAHGVYRFERRDGTAGYGDTLREAKEKADLEGLEPGMIEEETMAIENLIQREMTTPEEQPLVEPSVTPLAEVVPVEEEIQGGVSQFEQEPATHISGRDLDLAYSEEMVKGEDLEQQESMVIGPDPSTNRVSSEEEKI